MGWKSLGDFGLSQASEMEPNLFFFTFSFTRLKTFVGIHFQGKLIFKFLSLI